ncbi:MAG TPA: polysaccharide biosynthesis protein [Phycisphaeraceae bacterium]
MNPQASERAQQPGREPGLRTLLMGTAHSIGQLAHVLEAAQPQPIVVGCLLPASAAQASLALPACPVLGSLDQLGEPLLQAHRVEQVLISLPLAMGQVIREAAQALDQQGVLWRFLPTLDDQLAGRIGARLVGGANQAGAASFYSAGAILDPSALIDRQPRPLDEDAIRACLAGRTVLITGAGGSIGSELARTAARFAPARLLLVERSENALFEIDREIARLHPHLNRAAILHDVTHRCQTLELLQQHRPDVIFHAAAHKHVPMMEEHPAQAVENNFYGTRAIADAADACGTDRFVMISTDKAVNPSSVMGATKRLAELYIQYLNQRSSTTFSMVRFGNVLGSACSVLPIWAQQLAHGGPITVTHPQMQRYFMTIPEAAGLVLQAAAISGHWGPSPAAPPAAARQSRDAAPSASPASRSAGGEVFLLDMGHPVRILDLAQRFIRSQGLEPGVDVQIRFTGVRPGEKLYEELAYDGEDMLPTPHESIRIWRTTPPDAAQMQRIIATFDRLRQRGGDPSHPWRSVSRQAILNALRAAIPEMVRAAAG